MKGGPAAPTTAPSLPPPSLLSSDKANPLVTYVLPTTGFSHHASFDLLPPLIDEMTPSPAFLSVPSGSRSDQFRWLLDRSPQQRQRRQLGVGSRGYTCGRRTTSSFIQLSLWAGDREVLPRYGYISSQVTSFLFYPRHGLRCRVGRSIHSYS